MEALSVKNLSFSYTKEKQTIDDTNQDWNTKYGLENNNGLIQKDIHW